SGILCGTPDTSRGWHRSDRIDGLVSAFDGRARDHLSGGSSGEDPQSRDPATKTRPTRRRVTAAVTGRESLSDDLDALDRITRPAGAAVASLSMGPHATHRRDALRALYRQLDDQ